MRRVKAILGALSLVGAMSVAAQAQGSINSAGQKSLYERLGGLDAIKAVVGEFAARVVADERVNKKFVKSDAPRLTLHLVEQVCVVTGGPCEYTGQNMKVAHKKMRVTVGEFNALVEDLVKALDKFSVPAAEKTELLNLLAPLKSQIVEVSSQETGTVLPADFKPAKPLSKKQTAAGAKMKKM